ncbi:uncharacterized protein LOC103700077 [Phoenix dactylifera]|uniref:Uncharacterized protein LOC103700077 n=1 Tax=Phoenix dactylifera TaxID=42345 RepID=A0A8B7BKY0_PHODC|nr:uncharacterized protein LOC103700077 [Phoenix dactylifera]
MFYPKTVAAFYVPSGVLQILWQALQLPAKTATFFFPLLVLTLFCSSCVFYANFSCIAPVLMDLFSKLSILLKGPGPGPGPEYSHVLLEIKNDLKQVAGSESIITLLSFSSSLLLLLATVYSFAMAYSGTPLTLKELLARVARRWYQTLVTRLYVVLLSLGFGLLSSMVIGTAMLVCDDSKYLMSSGLSLSIVAAAVFIYLWTRWSMSFVITVVEETWGIGALSWSVELFIGNEKKGWTLTFILMLLKMVIYGVFGFMMMSGTTPAPAPPPPPTMEDQLRIGFLAAAASALLDIYAMAVYTVFYYECRKSHGLDEMVKGDEVVYTSLPAPAVKIEATTFP